MDNFGAGILAAVILVATFALGTIVAYINVNTKMNNALSCMGDGNTIAQCQIILGIEK